MNKLFVDFINRLEKMSGNRDLCEAVLQGYLACHPIMEDAAKRAQHSTREFIRSRFGESIDAQSLELKIRNEFFHNDYINKKFEPGVARIAFDNLDFQGNRQDNIGIATLKNILKIISSSHADEYNKDLNGLSFEQLKTRFGKDVARESEETYNRINTTQYEKNNSYRIVEIHSFEEAQEYAKWTEPYTWCITESEDAWDTYSGNGRNRAYFVLKDGFEKMKPIEGEGHPLDEYGLSMFGIFVTNDANDDNRPALCSCACRWNHHDDGGKGDTIMDVEQISNVIGQSFYDAFKPFSLEELHSRGIYTFREKLEKYNETHDRSLFDYVSNFYEGYARVELNGEYNWIDKDGNLLWKGEEWFDSVDVFSEGYAVVKLNGKYNFIDKDGNFLWNGEKWVDYACDFDEGYARIELNGKWSFIDKDGELIGGGDKWFDGANDFHNGYAKVGAYGKRSLIGKDGELIGGGKKWFRDTGFFFEGYATVVDQNGKQSFIDEDGELIGGGDKWFDQVYRFKEGYARVELNGKLNFIDKDGDLLWKGEKWFDDADNFDEGYAEVEQDGKRYKIDKDGKISR